MNNVEFRALTVEEADQSAHVEAHHRPALLLTDSVIYLLELPPVDIFFSGQLLEQLPESL